MKLPEGDDDDDDSGDGGGDGDDTGTDGSDDGGGDDCSDDNDDVMIILMMVMVMKMVILVVMTVLMMAITFCFPLPLVFYILSCFCCYNMHLPLVVSGQAGLCFNTGSQGCCLCPDYSLSECMHGAHSVLSSVLEPSVLLPTHANLNPLWKREKKSGLKDCISCIPELMLVLTKTPLHPVFMTMKLVQV